MRLRRLLGGRGVGKSGLRVAFLTSEAVPFAKTGGLGDVSGALPKALVGAGLDACLVHPLYATTDRRLLSERVFDNLEVEWRERKGTGADSGGRASKREPGEESRLGLLHSWSGQGILGAIHTHFQSPRLRNRPSRCLI